MLIEHDALRFSLKISTVSRIRSGEPPLAPDGIRVIITIGNGSRIEALHGKLVSKSTDRIVHSDTLSIEFLTCVHAINLNSQMLTTIYSSVSNVVFLSLVSMLVLMYS